MTCRKLTAVPVYNEVDHVTGAVAGALSYCREVLVVDDGSSDGTGELLAARDDVYLIRHPVNRGYGAALRSAFEFAVRGDYDVLVTIDCDGQHQPQLIPKFVERCCQGDVDIVSGSRYLRRFPGDSEPPEERRRVNQTITQDINRRLGLHLTDAFCGFKAYRVAALNKLALTESGYAMPLELWAQAARLGLRIVELAVPLVYLDESRSFGGALDDSETRLAVYRRVLDKAVCGFSPRLAVSKGNRSSLVEPPFDCASHLIETNVGLRAQRHCDLQGRTLADVSRMARAELLDAARRWTGAYRDVSAEAADPQKPILLAGHQPQMFHPGVWFKNFLLGALAAKHGATAVNLMIDGDTISGTSLRVPGETVTAPHAASIAFDRPEPQIPYEERTIQDRAMFESFGRRVIEQIASLVPDPLIERYWPMVLEQARHTTNLGACIAQARHRLEGDVFTADQLFNLGESVGCVPDAPPPTRAFLVRRGRTLRRKLIGPGDVFTSVAKTATLEVPQSWLCKGEAFQWFIAHLLARLPQFQSAYNDALDEYRRLHGVRNPSHPAPDLTIEGPWLEAPLWIWTADDPRRRRLFARAAGGEVVLTDRQTWEARLPLSDDGDAARAVERLLELQAGRVRIRPRALVTTLWARLALGDLFLHGVGGAKYDRVTDRLIERFFGLTPPAFMVASATLHLPIERPQANADDLRAIDRELRELTYHPERYLTQPENLLADKRRWIDTAPTGENAKERCQAIRAINAALQPWLEERRGRLAEQRADAAATHHAEKILASREYAFCLYPEATLREFYAGALEPRT